MRVPAVLRVASAPHLPGVKRAEVTGYPAQRLSRRLRVTPSPWEIKQGGARTEAASRASHPAPCPEGHARRVMTTRPG